MSQTPDNQRRPTYEELAENAYLRKRVAELEAVVEDLRAQIEKLRRLGKRQAAPFSKGKPKENPKRPGRKKGHPPAHRSIPKEVDRVEDVELPFHICPDCGGHVEVIEVQEQYQTDIPPIQPVSTRFDIEIDQCQCCGKRVQGRHREQTSDALGKAAVQVGPQSLALGAQMKHELGLSYGKIQSFFESLFHFPISRATFSRADSRLCRIFEPTYGQMILSIREKEAVNVDETGWRISGRGARNHSVLASVIKTCRQKGEDFCAWAKQLLCDPDPQIPPRALEGRPQPP